MSTCPEDPKEPGRRFESPEQEAYITIGRTWSALEHQLAEMLKPHGLTPTQYNVLRILRRAGDEGLCRNEIIERMIARVPDATRMLDRLESAGLIERCRSEQDRRFVTARIRPEGRELLAGLDEAVSIWNRNRFEGLDRAALVDLTALLHRVLDGL